MKTVVRVLGLALLLTACSKSGSSSSAPAPAPATAPAGDGGGSGSVAGTVLLQLSPKEGAPESSIAGAAVAVEGRPEVSALSDASGVVSVPNMLPGTVALYVTSAPAAGLVSGAATYGLKIPDVVVRGGETTDLGTQALKETGSLSGTVQYFANPNDLDRTGIDVFVPGTSFIAKTDENGRFSLPGLPEGDYALRVQRDGFAVLDLVELKVVEAKDTDLGTVYLSLSTGPEGSIAIDADLTATLGGKSTPVAKSRTVTARLTYDSDTALMKIAAEPSFMNTEWKPVAATATWTFDADGPKSLYVMYSDLNGLESSPFSVDFVVDTEAPSLSGIQVLYDWSHTAQRTVFVDVSSSDTGTGVAQVLLANDASFAGATWQAYAARIPWTLTAGAGAKTVYAKVKDHAGRESVVKSDDIVLGTHTRIANRVYDAPVVLYKAQSPFLAQGVTLDSDLVVEPGVVLNVGGSIELKGVVKALGTASEKIRIKTLDAPATGIDCDGNNDLAVMTLRGGLPGASEKSRYEHVVFEFAKFIAVNGGHFKNVHFDNGACTAGYGGVIIKTGFETLVVDSSQFTRYAEGVRTEEGIGATTLKNSTGLVKLYALHQMGATESTFSGNTFKIDDASGCMLSVATGKVVQDAPGSTTLTAGSQGAVACASGSGVVNLDTVTASSCNTLLRSASGTGSVTLKNVTASCDFGMRAESGGSGSMTIESSSLTVKEALYYANDDMHSHETTLSVKSSTVACTNAAGICDLLFLEGRGISASHKLVLQNSAVSCTTSGGTGCRGFVTYNSATAMASFYGPHVTVTTSNVTWGGGRAFTPLAAASLDASTIDAAIIRYELGYEDGNGDPVDGAATWVFN